MPKIETSDGVNEVSVAPRTSEVKTEVKWKRRILLCRFSTVYRYCCLVCYIIYLDIVFVFAVGLWVGQLLYYAQMSPKVKMEESKGASEVATGVDEDQRKLFVGGLAQVFIWSCLYSKSQDDRTCL